VSSDDAHVIIYARPASATRLAVGRGPGGPIIELVRLPTSPGYTCRGRSPRWWTGRLWRRRWSGCVVAPWMMTVRRCLGSSTLVRFLRFPTIRWLGKAGAEVPTGLDLRTRSPGFNVVENWLW